jgi:hypothetical protein
MMTPNGMALGLVGARMICAAAAQMSVDCKVFLAGIAKSAPLVRPGKPENIFAGEPRA